MSTVLKTFDTFDNIATTSTSATSSVTGYKLLVLSISTEFPSGFSKNIIIISLTNNAELKKLRKHYERAPKPLTLLMNCSENVCRIGTLTKKEDEHLCNL